MNYRLTIEQISQLIEIDRAADGIGEEVQGFITRLTSGGVGAQSDDPRIMQAKRLWDRGFGRELGKETFEDYLADIPEIPASLMPHNEEFPLLILVDPRLGISEICKLIGIQFTELDYTDEDVVPCDDRHVTPKDLFWVRMHDGRKNHNRRPFDCRKECTDSVYALTAIVGIMGYVQHPEIVEQEEHVLDLPGSVHAKHRDESAYLKAGGRGVTLGLRGDDNAYPLCGSGCFIRE